MENFIKELIALDRKARDTVAAAEKARDDAKLQISREKEQLYQQRLEEAKQQVEERAEAARMEATRQLEEAQTAYRAAAAALDDQVAANKDAWVRTIVENCKQLEPAE